MRNGKPLWGYILISPFFVLLGVFFAYPILAMIATSFFSSKYGLNLENFVGLGNYVKLFFNDQTFWNSCKNTVIWTAGNLLFQMVYGMIGAFILNMRALRFKNALRAIAIVPWVLSPAATALMFRWVFEPSLGFFDPALIQLGLLSQPFGVLAHVDTAMLTTILIQTWKFAPFGMILIVSAMETIPASLNDAASLDGASLIKQFRYVTLPLITPILGIVSFLGFIWTFCIFDLLWLTTAGGPASSTETLALLIYRRAILEYRMSEGSAIAVITIIIMIVISIFYFKFLVKKR